MILSINIPLYWEEEFSPKSFPSIGRGNKQHTCPFFSGDEQSNLNLKQYFGAKRGFAPIALFN